jgi:hypothetical protein
LAKWEKLRSLLEASDIAALWNNVEPKACKGAFARKRATGTHMDSDPTAVDELCRQVYSETARFYERLRPELGERAFGYKILYGPPKVGAPILFLAFQPGGEREDAEEGLIAGEREGWPSRNEYAYAPYRLARKMQMIWGADLLDRCVGLNIVFFRSKNKDSWGLFPPDLRDRATQFCLRHVRELVRVLRPKLVVVIGFGTAREFVPGQIELQNDRRRLIQGGTLWGNQALAVIHLSGANPALDRAEIAQVADYFRKQISD